MDVDTGMMVMYTAHQRSMNNIEMSVLPEKINLDQIIEFIFESELKTDV